MSVNKEAIDFIKRHEGFSKKIYKDSVGIETIGYGRNLRQFPLSTIEKEKIEHDGGYSEEDALKWLITQISAIEEKLEGYIWFKKLDNTRKAIILDMAYNLGIPRLLLFKKMILALNISDYKGASREMLNSGWAMQVKNRAKTLSAWMENADVYLASKKRKSRNV